jgi:hypothetical protein
VKYLLTLSLFLAVGKVDGKDISQRHFAVEKTGNQRIDRLEHNARRIVYVDSGRVS